MPVIVCAVAPQSDGNYPDTGPVWGHGSALELPSLDGDAVCDVCVVGLGGSGLAAVSEARRRGLDVIGIDAGRVAGGAAGRNGGFLLAGIAPFHHDAVGQLGVARATALYRLTLDEVAAMEAETPDLVRKAGSLRIAASPEELTDCEAQLARMVEDGLPASAYSGAEGEGLLFPEDRVFDPLTRCRRVASLALAEGARLFEGTAATTISRDDVVTPRGRIDCGAVVVAVDGGLDRVLPELAGHVRTARLQMLATAPDHEVRLPRPVYRRYGYEYYQALPDGRVALGGFRDQAGAGEWTYEALPNVAVQERLERFLRGTIGVSAPVTHRWAALVGFSRGPLPVFAKLRGGVVAIGGYSGTGNVVGSVLGREAVAAAMGDVGSLSGLFDLVTLS